MARNSQALTRDDPPPPGWWRRHSPAIDMKLLTRVLTGLQRIPLEPDDPGEEEPPASVPPAEEPPPPPADLEALAAIRDSFAALDQAGDTAAGCFYATLFASSPQLRALFPPAMDEQRDRLLGALRRIAGTVAEPAEFAAYLGQLGRDHRKYQVTPGMYEPVGAALDAALRRHAGPVYTPEARRAWDQMYRAVSAMMIRAAEDDAARVPGVLAGGGDRA